MLASSRISSLFLFAAFVAACGSRTPLDTVTGLPVDAGVTVSRDSGGTPDAGLGFPVGTYTSCAQGFFGPDGNVFLNGSGIEASNATLVVTQQGSTLDATFTDENGTVSSFVFDQTTESTGSLLKASLQSSGLCVQGPGSEGSFAAVIDATSGDLTYDASTVFISVEGTVTGGEGSPCGSSTSPARVWIVCGGTEPAEATVAGAASFSTGTYACTSQLDSTLESEGIQDFAASGDTGTLVVTQRGGALTATYAGDTAIAGSLDFVVTSATTASVAAGASLSAPCIVPIDTTGPPLSGTPELLSISAASLVIDGAALTLTFRGTMTGAECGGALTMGSLLCAPQ